MRLTGPHPQDLLDINKLRFQAPGGQQDIVALREGVKYWREVMKTPEVEKYVEKEVHPGAGVTTDEDLDNYVLESVFGEIYSISPKTRYMFNISRSPCMLYESHWTR